MHMRAPLLALLVVAAFVGCTASGASTSNFDLKPQKIGWFTGETAHFTLNISKSMTHSAPSFTIDRQFAVEEIKFNEKGLNVGGSFDTKNPNDVNLTLMQNGTAGEQFTLNATSPSVDVYVKVPDGLRNSEYTLEIKLFNVGWIKSDTFRVDTK
jgi:hypothetical protein